MAGNYPVGTGTGGYPPGTGGGGGGAIINPDAYASGLLLHSSTTNDGFFGSTITPYGTAPTSVSNPDNTGTYNQFSTNSIYASGAGYIRASSNPAFVIGTDDFSFEFFIYPLSSAFNFIFDTRTPFDDNSSGFYVCFSFPGDPSLDQKISFGSTPGVSGQWIHGNTALSLNEWHHVIVTRVGGTAKLVIDGVVDVTTAFNYNITGSHAAVFAAENATATINAYFNEMRFVTGATAYPSAPYVVPTSPIAVGNLPSPPTQWQVVVGAVRGFVCTLASPESWIFFDPTP